MKVRYDPEADILYILIKEGEVKDTVEVGEDVFIEYGEDEEIIGIEIWQARKSVIPGIVEYIEKAKTAVKA
ncbi:DUF2283 domain-containing protein [Archaeoglobus veneficus]|uniref:DUF2283 domain-containing protein n=1 Tax=Archaeoglobus veneficus (strain DSM 11195 / SNP6) TaxID=693661 RepID=F2KP88_ARCVS|nr:DUF2283 domain-containing protein [Archaeoglobus veneficus]AEA47492.1 Protein of unknown function DUF2283 [Archaeoglobus veneficus SNP6]